MWRETQYITKNPALKRGISIHSLRVEGDSSNSLTAGTGAISIHSLRVEGDNSWYNIISTRHNFNPLPPCGGRRQQSSSVVYIHNFNPLPPCGGRLWRRGIQSPHRHFNPLPPCGGRQSQNKSPFFSANDFNPLPPCGGRPFLSQLWFPEQKISIHSLRVEGDFYGRYSSDRQTISIHSLRVEGDSGILHGKAVAGYFNPLPPCGGRPEIASLLLLRIFISIHSLRVEGDKC